MKVIIAVAILLVITSYSGDTDKKTGFGCTSSSGVCTPNCNNEVNVCQGTTFADSCGNANACVGTKDCTTPTCEWVSNEPDNLIDYKPIIESISTNSCNYNEIEYGGIITSVLQCEYGNNDPSYLISDETCWTGFQSLYTYKGINILGSPGVDYTNNLNYISQFFCSNGYRIKAKNIDAVHSYIDEFYTQQCS